MSKGLPRSMRRAKVQEAAVKKLTYNLIDVAFNVVSVGAAVAKGTLKLDALPEGNILLYGAVAYVKLAGPGASADLSDTWNGDFSIGSVSNTNDVDLADPGEADIITSTSTTVAAAEVSPSTRATNVVPVVIDNTDLSKGLFLNVLIDAADIGDDKTVVIKASVALSLIVSGMLDD